MITKKNTAHDDGVHVKFSSLIAFVYLIFISVSLVVVIVCLVIMIYYGNISVSFLNLFVLSIFVFFSIVGYVLTKATSMLFSIILKNMLNLDVFFLKEKQVVFRNEVFDFDTYVFIRKSTVLILKKDNSKLPIFVFWPWSIFKSYNGIVIIPLVFVKNDNKLLAVFPSRNY